MLAGKAQPPPPIILSADSNNYALWEKNFQELATYQWGASGTQLITLNPIPLKHPEPRITDLAIDANTGLPLINRFKFERRPLLQDEQEEFDGLPVQQNARMLYMANIPLSDRGSKDFQHIESLSALEMKTRLADDRACLGAIMMLLSAASKTAVKSHALYPAHVVAAEHEKSLTFFLAVRALHQVGNAAVKFARTVDLLNLAQHNDPFETWVDRLAQGFTQFAADFESQAHLGYVSISELHSFIFLQGSNRTQFSRVYHEQLQATPSGRFPDTAALITLFTNHKFNNSMSIPADPVSTQLSNHSYAAAAADTTTAAADATSNPATRKRRTHPQPCHHCLAAGYPPRYGHLATECSNRSGGNKKPAPAAKALAATAATPAAIAVLPAVPAVDPMAARMDRLEELIQLALFEK